MASEQALTYEQTLERLDALATNSLQLWHLPESATARLINVSENATYLVEAPGDFKSILRVHRQDYHTRNAIACEIAWLKDLGEHGSVITPGTLSGTNGEIIQENAIEGLTGSRYMVMFEFVEGKEPDENENLVPSFEQLGEIAARTHLHSLSWQKPEGFERLIWNTDTVFGSNPTWGDWRDAPAMTKAHRQVLQALEQRVQERLQAYGQGPERYGLIHADMRLANLLVHDGSTRLIDFDDCGFGWFMYDFAAGISFMEDNPQVPALKTAWLKGYRKVRSLPAEDEHEIDTFIMLRRMALCAWIGSHNEVDIAQQLSSVFVPVTVQLAEHYLQQFA
ncbi:MAG: phosphotransferase enzyme family protein [Granulosicoccus sp.]